MSLPPKRLDYAASIAVLTLILVASYGTIDAAFLINTRISPHTVSSSHANDRSKKLIILQTESSGGPTPKKSGTFTLSSLFGGGNTNPSSSSAAAASTVQKHPSVRPHRSPLNLLSPDHKHVSPELPLHPEVTSGVLENGLSYVILPNRSPPGRFEAHLQVFSGSGMSFACLFPSVGWCTIFPRLIFFMVSIEFFHVLSYSG